MMGDKRLTVRTSADIAAKNSTAAETAKPLLIGHVRGQGYSGHTAEKGHTHIADPQSRGRGETQGCSRSARVTCTVASPPPSWSPIQSCEHLQACQSACDDICVPQRRIHQVMTSPIAQYAPMVMQNVAKYRTWLFEGTASRRLLRSQQPSMRSNGETYM